MLDQAEDMAMELNTILQAGRDRSHHPFRTYSIGDYNNNIDFELYNEAEVCRKSIESYMVNFCTDQKYIRESVYINAEGREVCRVIRNEVRSSWTNLKGEPFFREAQRLKPGEIHIFPVEPEKRVRA